MKSYVTGQSLKLEVLSCYDTDCRGNPKLYLIWLAGFIVLGGHAILAAHRELLSQNAYTNSFTRTSFTSFTSYPVAIMGRGPKKHQKVCLSMFKCIE